MKLSHKEFKIQWKKEQKKKKRGVLLGILALVIVFLISLCFRTQTVGFIPKETFFNLWDGIKLGLSTIFRTSYVLDASQVLRDNAYFAESMERLEVSFFTVVSGMGLGLAGAVFQQVYKNPIASPSTIGATAGVSLGNMLMVLMFSYTAVYMVLYRYIYCIVITLAIMVAVLLVGRVLGHAAKEYSVVEMLMFGSIISRMITAYNTYTMYTLNAGAFQAYQQFNLGINQTFSFKSLGLFTLIMVVCITLLMKMRFRINSVGLDPMEAKASGVNMWRERVLVQLLAALLIAAACIQCGDVGLFALVVPHFVRFMVGSDFRKLAIYSTIFGGILLLVMRIITCFFFMDGETIPVNFIVSIVMIPIFFVIIAVHRRGFD